MGTNLDMLDDRTMEVLARVLKGLLATVIAGLFLYFIVLPLAWRAPEVDATLPDAWPMSQDLSFTVRLTALHDNFDVVSIRLYVDHYQSTAKGPEGLFYPAMLFDQRPRAILSGAGSQTTYRRTRDFDVIVPFREFAQQGLVGPGTLTGKVDVTYVSYTPSPGRHFPGVDRMRRGMHSLPFTMTIRE